MSPLIAITLYMILQFGIGIWVARRIKTEADYILAGRNLGYGLLTFSIFATWFGAETIVGSAGLAYRNGVSLGSAEPFGYGLCLILMGLVFAAPLWRRKLTTLADYILAGRNLGYGLLTFSIFATWFGAETIVGSAGLAYRNGVSLGSAEPFGYGLCLILMGLVFAAPLWRRKLTTLADLFKERFSVGAERLAAVILIPSSILWAAAQIRGFGYVITTATDSVDGELAIGIAAGFTILYATFGGLLVDAINDVMQGIILSVGLLILFIAVVMHAGGLGTLAQVVADPARVHVMPQGESVLTLLERWAIPIGGSVIATELVGRIIAARSPIVARRSSYFAATLYIAVGLMPVMIGLLGPRIAPNLMDGEQLLPFVARDILPIGFYAVFAGALIAAILSTVDSTLLVSSALLSHNLIVPLAGVTSERRKVLVARGGVISFGIIAYVLALHAEGVFALVEQASAFGSAGTLVTVTFGLFTTWGGARTAIATLATGMILYVAANAAGAETPFLISLGASLACYLIGSVVERSG